MMSIPESNAPRVIIYTPSGHLEYWRHLLQSFSIVMCFSTEPTRVEHLSGILLQARFVALASNTSPGWRGLQGANPLSNLSRHKKVLWHSHQSFGGGHRDCRRWSSGGWRNSGWEEKEESGRLFDPTGLSLPGYTLPRPPGRQPGYPTHTGSLGGVLPTPVLLPTLFNRQGTNAIKLF